MESLLHGGDEAAYPDMTILNEYNKELRKEMDMAGVLRKTYTSKPKQLNSELYFEWYHSGTTVIWVESDYSVKQRIKLNNAFFNDNSIQEKV